MANAKNTKTSEQNSIAKPRKLKSPKYSSFKLQKYIKIKQNQKLSNSWILLKKSLLHLKNNKRVFLIITLIYAVATLVLVRGFGSGSNLEEVRESLTQISSGSKLGDTLVLFGVLVSGSGNSNNELASGYQTLLILVFSLAIIWALRQTYAGEKIKAKDSLYKGMYPIIPFVLVILVVSLQLLPMIIGTSIYSIVIGSGLAVTVIEKFLWAIFLVLTIILSLYMITSSLFALYIVTLPDMTPMRALRSARELVRFRRWTIMRKIIMLPVFLLLMSIVLILPIIFVSTVAAVWVFFLFSMVVLVLVHSYMYALYRELL